MSNDSSVDYYKCFDDVDPYSSRNDREDAYDEIEPPWERFYDEHDDLEREWYGEDEVER